MKKALLLSFTLIISLTFVNAQTTIMPYIQSGFSHFATFPDAETQLSAYNYRKNTEPILSYAFGFAANYKLSEKWAIKTGWEFQKMGDKIFLNVIPHIISYPSYNRLEISESHLFVNIPIQVQYNFVSDKKATPFIAFGTSLSWNFYNYTTEKSYLQEELVFQEFSNNRDKTNYEPQKINFTFQLDAGFNRQLTEKLSLNTFLSGNMLLLPTVKSEQYNARHFNVSLGLGLGYAI